MGPQASHTRVSARVSLRPVSPGDGGFLVDLFECTRDLPASIDPCLRRSLLEMQFEARRRHYEAAFPGARREIVLIDGRPAGSLTTALLEGDLRLVEISLLPEDRNAGVGGSLLRMLQSHAMDEGLQVTLHVDKGSPALRLYRRLGFSIIADEGPDLLMVWHPPLIIKDDML